VPSVNRGLNSFSRGFWFLLLTIILVVLFASVMRFYLHKTNSTAQIELRNARTQLTQMHQQVHVLDEFALKLKNDEHLRSAVEFSNGAQAVWQSPLARTKLRLIDALNQLSLPPDVVPQSLKVEWLSERDKVLPVHSLVAEQLEQRAVRLHLSVDVQSVPSGIRLLSVLASIVYPYPLQAQACSYQRTEQVNVERMRCLLELSAWSLPQLAIPNNVSESISTPEKFHKPFSNATDPVETWKVFSRLHEEVKKENKLSSAAIAKPIESVVQAQGVVTGPAGTLVIRER